LTTGRIHPLTALNAAGAAAAVLVIAFLPAFLGGFRTLQMGYVGLYFIALLGLNILTGYTGQISLGHGAFMALGAYTTAILVSKYGWAADKEFLGIDRDLATLPLAGLLAGVVGFLFGFPALRLAGVYLALVTLGLAVAVPSLAKRFPDFTGGGGGIQLFRFPSGEFLYYLSWGIAAPLFVLAWLLLRGRTGRAFRALRDNEIAAASLGVNRALYSSLAFGISAFYAGIAGVLYGPVATSYVNPDTFPLSLSILLLTGVVVAGLGSLWGVFWGAMFVEFVTLYGADVVRWIAEKLSLEDVLQSERLRQNPGIVYGVILILIMFVIPGGAAGLFRRLLSPLTNRLRSRQIDMPPRPTTHPRREQA
jgi:branched-chain amino acid transport system permease protein